MIEAGGLEVDDWDVLAQVVPGVLPGEGVDRVRAKGYLRGGLETPRRIPSSRPGMHLPLTKKMGSPVSWHMGRERRSADAMLARMVRICWGRCARLLLSALLSASSTSSGQRGRSEPEQLDRHILQQFGGTHA